MTDDQMSKEVRRVDVSLWDDVGGTGHRVLYHADVIDEHIYTLDISDWGDLYIVYAVRRDGIWYISETSIEVAEEDLIIQKLLNAMGDPVLAIEFYDL